MEYLKAASNVELLLLDCDGVLTDGKLYFSASGEAMKAFHVRDGQGIALWHAAGFRSGIITGRDSGGIVEARAAELGMHFVRSASKDKAADLNEILAEAGVTPDQVAFVGDDVGDITIMELAGFPVAVADAVEGVKVAAKFVTKALGGAGAVREVIELLLAEKEKRAT